VLPMQQLGLPFPPQQADDSALMNPLQPCIDLALRIEAMMRQSGTIGQRWEGEEQLI
jgi:hypothetical protein